MSGCRITNILLKKERKKFKQNIENFIRLSYFLSLIPISLYLDIKVIDPRTPPRCKDLVGDQVSAISSLQKVLDNDRDQIRANDGEMQRDLAHHVNTTRSSLAGLDDLTKVGSTTEIICSTKILSGDRWQKLTTSTTDQCWVTSEKERKGSLMRVFQSIHFSFRFVVIGWFKHNL